MTKKIIYSTIAILFVIFTSCSKEEKKYDGDAQLAFSENEYEFNVTANSSTISIPIQLIASGWTNASGSVTTDPTSSCADAVSYTSDFTLENNAFSYSLNITVNYDLLSSGENTLILNLSSPIKVAKYYSTATIYIYK